MRSKMAVKPGAAQFQCYLALEQFDAAYGGIVLTSGFCDAVVVTSVQGLNEDFISLTFKRDQSNFQTKDFVYTSKISNAAGYFTLVQGGGVYAYIIDKIFTTGTESDATFIFTAPKPGRP